MTTEAAGPVGAAGAAGAVAAVDMVLRRGNR